MTSNRSQHLLIRTALGLNFCTAGTDEDTDPTVSSSIVSSATTSKGIVGDIRRLISGLFRVFPEGFGEDDRKVLHRRRGCNILVSFLSSCLRGKSLARINLDIHCRKDLSPRVGKKSKL
uniref:(northern house mosquito) hypothetical protein n=1 Tax=Culex pipiens TaxID=7175 RepID=A0A8D8ABA3_CULPI